ncbi:MAG: DegT/DnrJ/EryC1/StrS family aminotransferase [Campylobacterales bacterium]|nr:DegT/DnrJ/EryC1/StrS family aminotransferase [Campylobacterales bacterium]
MKIVVPFYRYPTNHNIGAILKEASGDASGAQNVMILEEDFKKYIGCEYAVSASSGTNALHLAMCALDLKRGDKVICSINAFVNVPEVVRHFDAEPIFVDCNSDDYMINPAKLKEAIEKNRSKKLRAVIVNHMGGKVAQLDEIYAIAKEGNIKVIEDATDAMGSKYKNQMIGSTGADMTVFSFVPHLVHDVVSGGMLVTDNELYAKRAKLYRNHGLVDGQGEGIYSVDYFYDMIDIGLSYNMSELNAAICVSRLKSINDAIANRAQIASIYQKELQGVKHITIKTSLDETNITNFFIEIDKNRDHFARELKKEGVEIRLHYIPLNFMEYYKNKYELKVFDFLASLEIYQKTVSLPLFEDMSQDEAYKVCEVVKKVANTYM